MHNLKALTAESMIYKKTEGLVHEMEISGLHLAIDFQGWVVAK